AGPGRCGIQSHAPGRVAGRGRGRLPVPRRHCRNIERAVPAMNPIRPKILVVDDTPANLVAMRHLLSRTEADIFEAGSGNEALALCLDHQFALVLLDVNMPEMDGFEVAQLISEADHLSETPIIFVTAAYADDINRIKGYRSGAVDYIAKPINDVILQ